ncbi:MAG: lysozyme inhibitor LprI family protein [Pseudomonadota bacterium]
MFRKLTALLTFGVVLGGGGPAFAVCEGADGVMSTLVCLDHEYKAADAELNAMWKKVMTVHPSGGDRSVHREEIRASQRAWIAFRDADCEAQSKIGIPKYWDVNRMWCLYNATVARTATLREVYVN